VKNFDPRIDGANSVDVLRLDWRRNQDDESLGHQELGRDRSVTQS